MTGFLLKEWVVYFSAWCFSLYFSGVILFLYFQSPAFWEHLRLANPSERFERVECLINISIQSICTWILKPSFNLGVVDSEEIVCLKFWLRLLVSYGNLLFFAVSFFCGCLV